MYRVSGPVVGVAIKSSDTKLFLFGDVHGGHDGRCVKCTAKNKCLHISDFIKHLSLINKHVDVFLESPWLPKSERLTAMPPAKVDVITSVVSEFHEALYGQMGATDTGTRVHYTDVRSDKSFGVLTDLLVDMFAVMNGEKLYAKGSDFSKNQLLSVLKAFKTTKRLKTFIDIVVLKDDYVAAVKQMFRDSDIGNNFVHEDSLSYSPLDSQQKLPRVHRIRKQILKLNPRDLKSIMRFHNHRCREIQKETMDYDNYVRKIVKTGGDVHKEDALEIFYALLLWTSHLKDIYTLSRMLFYMCKNARTTIITYDGASHTMTYKEFFMKYVDDVTLSHEDNHIDNRMKRCVSLPKHVVDK